MSDAVRKDGRLRCSYNRDSHSHWPRLKPCNKLAVVKHQPKESVVFAYYCDEHAEWLHNQDDIVQRSSQGFLVKDGKGYLFQIVPVAEDKQPQIIQGMGQAIQHIARDDERYPERMRSYRKSPDILSCLGDISLLNTPSVAIVGMRQPTMMGQRIAYSIAAFFARAGYTIVSGLAQGIDIAALQGALSVRGRTIAILETPLGNVYPRQNRELAQAIVQRKGLLFTNFYTNNTIINGVVEPAYLQSVLPLVVIPIQTGVKGGTLHICRSAQMQNHGLWIPLPVESDEQEHPECYVGIRLLLKREKVVSFAGKENYPMLLELLQKMQ